MGHDDDSDFRVHPIDYASGLLELRAIRTKVFVEELAVPPEIEADALDPRCLHVIARAADESAIGTGRLVPPSRGDTGPDAMLDPEIVSPSTATSESTASNAAVPQTAARIGRLAVLPAWRNRGVGAALLRALLEQSRQHGWHEVVLDAQVTALEFYLRHGFVPVGERFITAGIEHQTMRRRLAGASAVEDRETAVAIASALIVAARRGLWIYSRELDPGLLDAPIILEALRRFGTTRRGSEARILLQDATVPQRMQAPLLALAQRLPSVFVFRQVADPVDRAYASAFITNDAGGYYFRGLGHRFDGEADLHGPGRARQLRSGFERVWERSRAITEYRALGI